MTHILLEHRVGLNSQGGGLARRDYLLGFCTAALTVRLNDSISKINHADQFVDSVGICTHLESELYAQHFDVVLRMGALLGLRHIRDEIRPSNNPQRWRRLATEAGIQSHLLVSPATNTIKEMLDFIQVLGAAAVSAVEGQNEGDSPWFKSLNIAKNGWAELVVDYQRAVFQALRAHSQTRSIPVISPTVLDYRPTDMRLLGAAAPFCDYVGLHAYPQGWREPETCDDFAAITWYLRNMRDPFKPSAPVMVTETGYTTGLAGISDRAAAAYLPRLLLHLFAHGITRSFLYEFMDEGLDSNDPEQRYGLLTVKAEPKPAFHALRLLLAALSDPGPAFASDPVAVAVEQAPPDIRLLPFRKRSGEIVIAIWRAARVWDSAARRDVTVAPAAVRLRLPRGSAAKTLELEQGRAWSVAPVRDGRLSFGLAGKVTLIGLTP